MKESETILFTATEGKSMTTQKSIVYLCSVLVLMAGCASKRAGQEEYALPGTSEAIVRSISHDEKGLPLLGTRLSERPSRPGEHFAVVRLNNEQPVISYDIVVARQKPDFAKPLEAVYEWTGKGFTLGVNVTGNMLQGSSGIQIHNNDEARFVLAVIAAPIALGTVGGFIVGVADGVHHATQELSKVVVHGERVVTCTTYEYDELNRLSIMRMLSPDRAQELVRTEYVYEGAVTKPIRSVVMSRAENRERTIK